MNPMQSQNAPGPASLKKNALFNTVGSLTYQGCLWLTTVLVVLLTDGYADSGVLALAMTVGNVYEPIATYSMRVYQASDTNATYQQSQYVGLRIVTIIIGLCVIAPYAALVAQSLTAFISIIVFVFFKANEALCDVLYGVDQRYQRMDYIGVSQFIRGLGVLACFAAGIWFSGSLTISILLMLAWCVGITIVYDVPRARSLDYIRPNIDPAVVKTLLRTCLPIAVATLLLSLVVSTARQCFSFMYGIEPLGIYAAVATPAVLIQALARYLYSPVLVPLAELWTRNDNADFVALLRKTIVVMLVIVVVAFFALSLLGDPLLILVYGESIASYTYLFPYVLVSVSGVAFVWLLTDVLVVLRDLKGVLITNAVVLAVCLATMYPLELAFEMNGINFTIIIAMLAGIAVAAFRLARFISRRPMQ